MKGKKEKDQKRTLIEEKAKKEALVAVNACLERYGKASHKYDLTHLENHISKPTEDSILSDANVISVHIPCIQKKDKRGDEHTMQLFLKVDKEGNPVDFEEFYFSSSDREKFNI